jgi:EspG family
MTGRFYLPAISPPAFDLLWREWCRDSGWPDLPMPVVLDWDCPSPASSPVNRTAEIRAAHDELQRCGYHRGAVHPVLSALARPDVEINLRWEGGRPFRAIAVRRDHRPVLVWMGQPVRPDGQVSAPAVQLFWDEPLHLATELVKLLPSRPAAQVHGHAQSLSELTLRSASDLPAEASWTATRQALRSGGGREDACRAFADLTARECLGRGEFQVAVQSSTGKRLTSRSIQVNDTSAGRYLVTRWEGSVTMRGADATVLVGQLITEEAELNP